MKVFKVVRQHDISGVSGIGHIIDGVIFSDGTTVIQWLTKTSSTVIFNSYEDFYAVHIEPHPENNTIVEVREFNEGVDS